MRAESEHGLTWAGVVARRLERHGLAEPLGGRRPADVARAICGAHAQILAAGEASIALRMEGATRAEVQDALWREKSLVKTRGPRGTVHLLATEDLPMWAGALPAVPSLRGEDREDALLTPEQKEAVIEAIAAALEDAELTAGELTAAIVARTGPWAGELLEGGFQQMWPRWREAEEPATRRGLMCFGPNRGRNVTYTSPRRWLPGFRPAEPAAALARLVQDYLHAYGPATPEQFARWLAGPPRWAGELFASLGSALEQVEVEGSPAWVVAGDTGVPPAPAGGLRLLPYFDAYIVGSHPREVTFPGVAAERAVRSGQAGNLPVLLVDGVVGGLWHQRRAGSTIEVTVEMFGELTAARRRDLDEQVARAGEILGATPRLTLGPVTVGPHA